MIVKGVDIAIWSGLECNIAIMCACVPALKPLFSRAFPSFIASLRASSTHPASGGYAHCSSHTYDNISNYHRGPDRSLRDIDIDTGNTVQSFEMRATTASDDNASVKNLVTVKNTKKTPAQALG